MDQSVSPLVVHVYLEKTPIRWTRYTNTIDQSVSSYLFRKDTRHCDAMEQGVFPFVLHVYFRKDIDMMDQCVLLSRAYLFI